MVEALKANGDMVGSCPSAGYPISGAIFHFKNFTDITMYSKKSNTTTVHDLVGDNCF
jgi:hypothetical protein